MVQRFGQPDPSAAEHVLGRHARAEHNVFNGKATFAGGRVDSELTEDGIEAIALVVDKIVADGGCDVIACSTMKRSMQTAEIIAAGLKEQLGNELEVVTIEDLEEVDVGKFTEHTGKWSEQNYPEEANEFYWGDIHKWSFPGGENYQSLSMRVVSVLNQLRKLSQAGQKVVIIGHGMFNRVILSHIFPDRPELWQPIDWPHDRLIAFQLPDEIIVE